MSNSRTLLRKNTAVMGDKARRVKPGTPGRRVRKVFASEQFRISWNYHATKGWRRERF